MRAKPPNNVHHIYQFSFSTQQDRSRELELEISPTLISPAFVHYTFSYAAGPTGVGPMATEGQANGIQNPVTYRANNDENMSETSTPDHDQEDRNGYGQNEEGVPNKSQNGDTGTGTARGESEKPAWSEMKTKAGKERKRLPLACIACRRKKIRCSGEKPACKHCQKSRIPCVYKVTTRKAAPRTDYMAMLDKRLKRMEERVIKIIPAGETRDMRTIGRSQVKPPPQGQTPNQPKAAQQKKRSADEAFASKLDSWVNPKQDLSAEDLVPMSRETKSHEGTDLLTEGAEYLPSMEIQEHLSEVFFDCVYGQSYLLLHRSSFMRRLRAGTVPPVLILAVCAVSARFSSHPQINTEPAFLRGENWARPAARIALDRHDEPNITILTVFLLLGLHEFGTCHGGRSWSFGGQALRMAYALQLHHEVDHDSLGQKGKLSDLSFTDREIRRRTMWASFLMDRYNSSGSQRPPIGNEKFIQIQLPVKESHFLMEIPGPTEDLNGDVPNPIPKGQGQVSDPKANMGVSAYIIRAIVIWGHIVDYLNLGGKKKEPVPLWDPASGYTRLKQEIDNFALSLPSSLVFNSDNLQVHAAEKIANQFIFLHIIIHQNILFLNQFAIPLAPGGRPPKGMPKSFLSDAGRAAVEAAHHISMLIDQASGYSLTVPFAGYCAYSASTVHIWGIFSKNAQLEARSKENLRHTYRYLNKMKRYWGMFHYMVESAKDRYRQFADAAIRGLPAQPNSTDEAPSMFQYGDWFDKYPHGVSSSHWDGPETNRRREIGADAVMGQRPDLQSVEDFFASLSPNQSNIGPRKHQKLARRNSRQASSIQTTPLSQPSADVDQQSTTSRYKQQQEPQLLGKTPVGSTPTTVIDPETPYPNFNGQDIFAAPPQSFNMPTFDYSMMPDFLPQLDRHFVHGAYTGTDLSSLAADHLNFMSTPTDNTSNPSNANSNANNSVSATIWTDPFTPSGTGEFHQPSAWFLPFNLDPFSTGMLGDSTGGNTAEVDTSGVGCGGAGNMNGGNDLSYRLM
ncbi:C6 transcription factor, putative [Talaromyces stipitatus ATCC 10500]|uniref:C6 transcription factor, putative n=1 Tax=Talaromyces stipitatus (strain ATCC 10500 / CBS 375.48 / QM 6759 / NRRL 1006) TaxID=441959 RepID=B8M5S6_TALSN|nr:C6 transcription factor, putative [Talaromyces stipitatus ATCC 10500]EED20053.1 C6 transcription factor, putative [Talaromyces stipitatus ATCC 10500]